MKYYIIAGEASGDLHASNLMKSIKKNDKNPHFRYFGGDLMLEQGGELQKHYKELAFMGIVEVAKNLKTIKRNMSFCKNDILEYKPDVVILVDYPGFNLRIAEFAHKKGFKTVYYISPKIWAWKKKRAYKIKKYIDEMFVIFPFEIDFYKQFNYKVHYVGNPLIDALNYKTKEIPDKETFYKINKLENKPIIALVPGSRKQEIQLLLPEMLQIIDHFKEYQFIITGLAAIDKSVYNDLIENYNVRLIYDQTYSIIKYAKAALVTSGTATLETALLNIPQLVCYKIHPLTFFIGQFFVQIKYFSLVNIILQKEVVKELLQYNLADKMKDELNLILNNNEYRANMLKNYSELRNILGDYSASEKTAETIIKIISAENISSN